MVVILNFYEKQIVKCKKKSWMSSHEKLGEKEYLLNYS